MSRPYDWAPLAASDPVPGEEAEIRAMAKRYRDFAADLEDQAAILTRLSQSEEWDCDAGRAFGATAGEIAGQLRRTTGRYQSVGEALNTYATGLAQAQQQADAALQEAKQAESDVKAKQAAAVASGTPTPAPAPDDSGDAAMFEALSGPRSKMQRAIEHRDDAGRQSADRIREAIDQDGLGDSWWDKVKDWTAKNWDSFMAWVHEHAERINQIADVLGWISTALTIAGTVIAFIPVVNALAPAFFAVGAGLTAISLILHTMTALSGDGSWVAVGLDVVGLVTFGYGRWATSGARVAQAGLRAGAKETVTSAAKSASTTNLISRFQAAEQAGQAIPANIRTLMQDAGQAIAERGAAKTVDDAANQFVPYAKVASDKLTDSWVKPAVDWATGSKFSQKVLGMDAEVVVDTAGHRALASLNEASPAVDDALQTLASKAKVSSVADWVGAAGDYIDKSKMSDELGLSDKATFGWYTNK